MTVVVLVLAILLSKVGIIDLISKGYNAAKNKIKSFKKPKNIEK